MFREDACVHFRGKTSYHGNTMSFWSHHVELQTFCGIFKNNTQDKSTPSQLVLGRKMATSDEEAVQR